MTQYPGYPPQPPYDPLAYGTPGAPLPAERPGSITPLAIIGIVLGSIGVLCCGLNAVMGVVQLAAGQAMGMPADAPQLPRNVQVYSAATMFLSLALWLVCLIASIAALSLKEWARATMVLWSWVTIALAVVTLVVQITWVGPATEDLFRQMQNQTGPGAPPPGFTGIMGKFMIGAAVVTFVLTVIYPLCVAFLWTKPAVKAAFAGPGAYQR